ncbi:PAS domain-containing sensor histidine kinase [Patescibacteria group bacterium]|nr:PAS domain-containing sensor histidine kinase [Patescibacteria group bacterium]MBU1730306.1 PAS domain-containing sensor histidine kinase [Patescibacteria group bacterium]MBU1956331.1 PAS domain-containing sensor histidine kinase [Patescibacteria group bacterium]MBU2010246.1 PAS domain-containing sensor histidine kinase [Patescibacteria group bacterium]
MNVMDVKKLLSQLFSSIKNGSVLFDDKGVIFYVNSSACKFLHSQENQLLDTLVEETFRVFIDDVSHKSKKGIIFDIFNKNQQSTLLSNQTLYFVSVDGHKFSIEASSSCIEVDGKKIGLLLFRDIAENKGHDQKLIAMNAHIETIIDNFPVGFIEYDNFFCVKRINIAAENILGIKRAEILGLNIKTEDINKKEKTSLAMVSYPFLAKKGKTIKSKENSLGNKLNNKIVHEMILDFPIKREIEVTTISLVATKDNTIEGFIKIIRDITKERVLSRSKSDFINIAAHQFRTPLSAIKWILNMVLGGDKGIISSPQKKLLTKAYHTNEKMILLVDNLLNVTRIEDNRFGYAFKESSIIEAITDVVSELRLMAETGKVTLTFEKLDNIKPFIFDFSRIQLAIHNLINNAIKYTREGGTVKISLTQEDNDVVVEIQDSGIGIPADQIKQTFTKFFRAVNVSRLQISGSGLGLFIVKDIITRHGGIIGVKSIENKGTTVTVRLPMRMTVEETGNKQNRTT